MIQVYQIVLTAAEIVMINAGDTSPRIRAYYDREYHFNPEDFQHYEHVADVATNDMEEAFALMNLWNDRSRVDCISRCHSMSVGDILVTGDGERYRCASFGFEPF